MSNVPQDKACRAVVISCIDFRFFPWLEAFLRSERLHGAADVICWPGGALALTAHEGNSVREALAVSMRLHNPSQAILVAHEDCGWLKDREGDRDMKDLLRDAAQGIAAGFALESVRLVIIEMDGKTRTINA